MAERKRDKGTGAGRAARISDPFADDPLSFPHSPRASSTENTPETGPRFPAHSSKLPPGSSAEPSQEDIETREESFTSAASHPVDPLGGLRTSLDNLNVTEASASPRTPGSATFRVLGGEEEEPQTPPERILREGRPREAPGAPKKPRRPSGFDKEAMARVTKKLDFK